jgi:Fe-S cluster assembly protein SufD
VTEALAPERRLAEAFASLEAERAGEPAWLAAARKAAIARFAELGFPNRRHEEWKYTNPAPIAQAPWRIAGPGILAPGALAGLGLPLAERPHLVFVNGRFAPSLSRLAGLPPRVVATNAGGLHGSPPARLAELQALPEPLGDRAFAALAVAFAPDTAFVGVPEATDVSTPLYVVFVSAPSADGDALHPRLLVTTERGSRLALVEVHAGAGELRHLTNALAEVVVGENAQVDHVRLQIEEAGSTHLAHLHARIGRDARYTSRVISLGAGLSRIDAVGTLADVGAECVLDGLYLATDGQHVDCRTTVDHRRPHGTSRELYKGVLAGRARGIFSGKVVVRKEAQKTDAQQRNENLLLSGHAEVDSKPQLEIEANDVKCSHGSSIGQLEEDALFYLRARGLDRTAARDLLVRAFAGQIIAGLADPPLRARVEADVLARLASVEVPA